MTTPTIESSDRPPTVLRVDDLTVTFPGQAGIGRRNRAPVVRALDSVSLSVRAGECVGIVGESGCGKSTLVRTIAGLQAPDSGIVEIEGDRVALKRDRQQRRRVQLIFQDPYSALNPALKIGAILGELLRVHRIVDRSETRTRSAQLLESVGLSAEYLDAYPAALSGGQRQRVSIARALALQPSIVLADEVVSALDVSIQAEILNLLIGLRRDLGLTVVFISHDLAVVRQLCERVYIMNRGRIVEHGLVEAVFSDPQDEYTKALLDAIPRIHVPSPHLSQSQL
jgi:peptide/nickel transport system ATP-binding protein